MLIFGITDSNYQLGLKMGGAINNGNWLCWKWSSSRCTPIVHSSVVGCTSAVLMKDCSPPLACLPALNMTHHCQIVHTLRASLFGYGIFDSGIVPFVHFFRKLGYESQALWGEKRETVRSLLENPGESRWHRNVLKYPGLAHSGPGGLQVVVLISSCTGNQYIIDSSHYCKHWLSTCYWCLGFF